MNYKVAKSGEVFYIGPKGVLMSSPSLDEYEAMVNREKVLKDTVVSFTLNGTYHEIPVVNQERIAKLAIQLPIDEMNRVLVETMTKREELNL